MWPLRSEKGGSGLANNYLSDRTKAVSQSVEFVPASDWSIERERMDKEDGPISIIQLSVAHLPYQETLEPAITWLPLACLLRPQGQFYRDVEGLTTLRLRLI